jgi:hypothetical protein
MMRTPPRFPRPAKDQRVFLKPPLTGIMIPYPDEEPMSFVIDDIHHPKAALKPGE